MWCTMFAWWRPRSLQNMYKDSSDTSKHSPVGLTHVRIPTDGAELRAVTLGRSTLVPTTSSRHAPSFFVSVSRKSSSQIQLRAVTLTKHTPHHFDTGSSPNAPFCKKLAGPDRSRSLASEIWLDLPIRFDCRLTPLALQSMRRTSSLFRRACYVTMYLGLEIYVVRACACLCGSLAVRSMID